MNNTTLKIIGTVTTLAGAAISLVTKWVDDKTLDHKISEEVAKVIAEKVTKIEP